MSGNVSKLFAAAGHSLSRPLASHIRTRVAPLCVAHADIAERGQVGREGKAHQVSCIHTPIWKRPVVVFETPWLHWGRMLILFDHRRDQCGDVQVRWQQSPHLRPFFPSFLPAPKRGFPLISRAPNPTPSLSLRSSCRVTQRLHIKILSMSLQSLHFS